jgi:hypothetical protein
VTIYCWLSGDVAHGEQDNIKILLEKSISTVRVDSSREVQGEQGRFQDPLLEHRVEQSTVLEYTCKLLSGHS